MRTRTGARSWSRRSSWCSSSRRRPTARPVLPDGDTGKWSRWVHHHRARPALLSSSSVDRLAHDAVRLHRPADHHADGHHRPERSGHGAVQGQRCLLRLQRARADPRLRDPEGVLGVGRRPCRSRTFRTSRRSSATSIGSANRTTSVVVAAGATASPAFPTTDAARPYPCESVPGWAGWVTVALPECRSAKYGHDDAPGDRRLTESVRPTRTPSSLSMRP